LWDDLDPLVEMVNGAPNTAEVIRTRLQRELGISTEVAPDVLRTLAEEREAQVREDVKEIENRMSMLGGESGKIAEFLTHAREEARLHPGLPVRFRPSAGTILKTEYPDKTAEIIDLAQHLIRIPSVTACPKERLDEVHRAGTFVHDYIQDHGLEVRYFDGKYPAVFAKFPGADPGSVLLTGHFDVVEPEPDDGQFSPRIDGDYLWGRGAADMKTVVATYLVWMKDALKSGKAHPSISLLLVGNEENGESEAMGTPHVLKALKEDLSYTPQLLIAGERTGEKGNELFGEICIENRGVMRFEVMAHGVKAHTGVKSAVGDLSDRLISARVALGEIFARHLTLQAHDGWQSQAKFPFITVGTPGIYNVSAAEGLLGVEIRPIPQDDATALKEAIEKYCKENELEVRSLITENGVACDANNPALKVLIEAVRQVSGAAPKIGKKLAGTSARFAPNSQGVVWGQSGIGPHTKDERHYIPSIMSYYKALNVWDDLLYSLA
jgi:acetylornithine deacetylase/succinyl-diaminopimelate desuccinylase-like protein